MKIVSSSPNSDLSFMIVTFEITLCSTADMMQQSYRSAVSKYIRDGLKYPVDSGRKEKFNYY
ncbi:MAG: hypothetical protein LBS02_02120 [Hungatella sp.]|nr:hypothetical protein [Hungatella sp.]